MLAHTLTLQIEGFAAFFTLGTGAMKKGTQVAAHERGVDHGGPHPRPRRVSSGPCLRQNRGHGFGGPVDGRRVVSGFGSE